MQPTKFALGLTVHLAQLFEDTGRLMKPLAFTPATSTQTFGIAASEFFTAMMQPALMARLDREKPGVCLRYKDSLTLQTVDDPHEGHIDRRLLPKAAYSPLIDWRHVFKSDHILVARQDHPVLTAEGVNPAVPMQPALYARLRHAVFRVPEAAPDPETGRLAEFGFARNIALYVSTHPAVWRAVAATNLVGIVPRRMALQTAASAGLAVHTLPFDLTPDRSSRGA